MSLLAFAILGGLSGIIGALGGFGLGQLHRRGTPPRTNDDTARYPEVRAYVESKLHGWITGAVVPDAYLRIGDVLYVDGYEVERRSKTTAEVRVEHMRFLFTGETVCALFDGSALDQPAVLTRLQGGENAAVVDSRLVAAAAAPQRHRVGWTASMLFFHDGAGKCYTIHEDHEGSLRFEGARLSGKNLLLAQRIIRAAGPRPPV